MMEAGPMQRDDKGRFLEGHSMPEQTRRKISESLTGRTFSEEWRRRISEAHKGMKSSREARRKISESLKGNDRALGFHHSHEARRKISEAKRGEKHPRWKNGRIPYYGPTWNRQRRLARQRDKGICQECGEKENGREHDTHHIISFRFYGLERYKEANRLENLTTLCRGCHGGR